MKPSPMTTAEIVAYFKAGLTIKELARNYGQSVPNIEKAIRRWMVTYPNGKQS